MPLLNLTALPIIGRLGIQVNSCQIKAKSLFVRIVFGDWYNFTIKLFTSMLLDGIDDFSYFDCILLTNNSPSAIL